MFKVIIVGGGRVGIHLIELLKIRLDYDITLIDNNKEILNLVETKYEDVKIVIGDATNKAVLEEAGICEADIIVVTTGTDEVNLLIGIISKNYNLDKIIARTANPTHIKMFKKLGLNEVVSPELTAVTDIQKLIIKPNTFKMTTSSKEDYDLLEVTVKSNKVIGKEIGEISPSDDYIIIMYERNNKEFIAQNNIILEKEDKITLLVKSKNTKKVKKYFTKNGILSSI